MGRTVYSEPSLKLGAALAEIRREKGVLQEELATRLSKDQSLISNIERGHRRVDVLELYAIARALDIEPTDLFTRVIDGFPYEIEV